jgi:NAD-dependent DNA ligase
MATANAAMLASLEKEIRYASKAYYNSAPVMSDAEFDALVERVRSLDPHATVLAEVGAPVAKGVKVKLPYAMMSLDKVKSGTDKWARAHDPPFTVSDKLDGTSALFVGGKLYRRGTGETGANISHLVGALIPQRARSTQLAVRGEIIIRKADFKALRAHAADARSAANALVNAKVPNPVVLAKARFVAYTVLHPPMDKASQFRALRKAGFEVAWNARAQRIDDGVLAQTFATRRERSMYEVDGVVVDSGGVHPPVTAARNPTHAIAFKAVAAGQGGDTTVLEVEWSSSRDGRLTPRIRFKPVTTANGVVMQWATAHNARYVVDNGIGPGARVTIIRSGDVIPFIQAVVSTAPGGAQLPPSRPAWRWEGAHAVLDAVGTEGEVKAMDHFVTSLGVQGAREATLGKLHAAGITTPSALLASDVTSIGAVVGRGAARDLVAGLDAAVKRADPVEFMVASNVFGTGIGKRKLTALEQHAPGFYRFSPTDLRLAVSTTPGFGDSSAIKVAAGVTAFARFLRATPRVAAALAKAKAAKAGAPMVTDLGAVVFSGFRDAALERLAEARGFRVSSSVSAKTKCVVARDPGATTGKSKKARELGIPIISERDFRGLMK